MIARSGAMVRSKAHTLLIYFDRLGLVAGPELLTFSVSFFFSFSSDHLHLSCAEASSSSRSAVSSPFLALLGMPLSFGLKVVWFVLSLSGTVPTSASTLMASARYPFLLTY